MSNLASLGLFNISRQNNCSFLLQTFIKRRKMFFKNICVCFAAFCPLCSYCSRLLLANPSMWTRGLAMPPTFEVLRPWDSKDVQFAPFQRFVKCVNQQRRHCCKLSLQEMATHGFEVRPVKQKNVLPYYVIKYGLELFINTFLNKMVNVSPRTFSNYPSRFGLLSF